MLLTFAVVAYIFRGSPVLTGDHIWITLFLAGALIMLTVIDLDRYLLPDWLTLPLIILGLGYSYMFGVGVLLSGLGAAIGYVIIASLAYFWRSQMGREGIGLGDAKLLAAAGAWLGALSLPAMLLGASGLGLVFFAALSVSKKYSEMRQVLPFGPFIALAFWALWCAPRISV
jgi:leader peptidase (prepilin peptidase)/N-methyltransferase